jgi:hypothetical protein
LKNTGRISKESCGGLREQWWLLGSDTMIEKLQLGSNPAISSAYSGLPVLRWAEENIYNRDVCSSKNN